MKSRPALHRFKAPLPLTGSYGIDYLIGEEAYLGKGLDKSMIALPVDKIFSLPDAQRVTADIDKDSKASEGDAAVMRLFIV